MRFLSVCSGIEAASVASAPLGWTAAGFAEIDPFCKALLKQKYPTVPNYGDFTTIGGGELGPVELIAGGTPCQDFSIAGDGAGLDGERGKLTLEFIRLVGRVRPRWVFWENVPGVLSNDGGRAFGTFLGMLGQCGYGFAYRVLDAQWFGIPQRRRRVFVVGYLGNWRVAAAVLFERESLSWNLTPSRTEGKGIAVGVEFGPSGGSFTDVNPTLDARCKDGPIRNQLGDCVAMCLQGGGRIDAESETFVPIGLSGEMNANINLVGSLDAGSRSGGGQPAMVAVPLAPTLTSNGDAHSGYRDEHGLVAVPLLSQSGRNQVESTYVPAQCVSLRGREGGATAELGDEVSGALRAGGGGGDKAHALTGMAVRRLTPLECERLQGFPDHYTAVTYRGKPAADGPRYKALGNSWAVPCVRWIFERMDAVDKIMAANQ